MTVAEEQLNIVIKYEEEPKDADDEFQNKIILGKKFKSEDEPKLPNLSIEALIEKFCVQNPYLNGRAHELSLFDTQNVELDRGLVVGRLFAKGMTHNLKLGPRKFVILKSSGSINNRE